MALTSLGDLSTHFLLRRHNVALRTEMNRLGSELTTGVTSDKAQHLAGDYSAASDIERRLTRNAAFRQAGREAALFTETMQLALGHIQQSAEAVGTKLAALLSETGVAALTTAAQEARVAFDAAVTALNSQAGGRYVFAGATTDVPALAAPEAMLASLQTAVAGVTDPAMFEATVADWFLQTGGGFDTDAYQGSAAGLSQMQVAANERVDLDLRASHGALRAALMPLAMAALTETTPGLTPDARHTILRQAATGVFQSQSDLTAMRADLGVTQARLEETAVRLASEKTGLQQARADLLGVDPYEAATRLEAAQFNLESLYTLTVRLSRLSLTEYM